jgi:hypothetical protein
MNTALAYDTWKCHDANGECRAAQELADEARARAIDQFVADWADDALPVMIIEKLCDAFAREESGLLQQLLHDYRKGDGAEFEQTCGRLARALEATVKQEAQAWV